jgi:hypothetical protein
MLTPELAIWVQGKRRADPSIPLCRRCSDKAERAFQAETEESNLPAAALFGLLAAIVGTLVWYGVVVVTGYEAGIIAIGVGWIIAQAVMLGAGRKRGPALQGISLVITLLSMAASEYFIIRHFFLQVIAEEGYIVSDVPLILPLEDIWFFIFEGIKANPLTLLFWGIALWEAFVLPAKRSLRKVEPK